ncbi:MAG TPA: methyltransferase domain-containing protein [Roseiflexaceae bacterium]|nr:methyltransferase domain-containing protein [Roseiflexaceae bacterium]
MSAAGEPNDLDAGQYSSDSIRKYEAIYGRNFVSPGGLATALAVLSLVEIPPGAQVLDVGCGLGGAALLMAQRFGAQVQGVDVSSNMLRVAEVRSRQAGLAHAIHFAQADILDYDPPVEYDLAHSRDVFLHIHDKARLFGKLMQCLRPGGRLLFTDYLCGADAPSEEFAAYVRARGYHLVDVDSYRTLLERAGFVVERAEDRTDEFIAILERELAGLPSSRLPAHERDELAESWRAKIRRAQNGEQRWGVFVAQKPVDK